MLPIAEILIITVLFALGINIFSKVTGRNKDYKEMRENMKSVYSMMKKAKDIKDSEEIKRLNKEMLDANKKLARKSFRIMTVTILFFMAFAYILNIFYAEVIIRTPFGFDIGWFYYYLMVFIPSSLVFRKWLN